MSSFLLPRDKIVRKKAWLILCARYLRKRKSGETLITLAWRKPFALG